MNKHSKFRGLMDCIENSISSHGLTITELYQVMLETLSGVEKEHNQAISDLESELEAENQALRNELGKYKKQVASDDKYLDKASFIELERDQLRNELEALKIANDAMIETLSSISTMCIGKIAMGYELDAENIGQMIFASVGMTQPEMVRYVANKLEQDND